MVRERPCLSCAHCRALCNYFNCHSDNKNNAVTLTLKYGLDCTFVTLLGLMTLSTQKQPYLIQ